MHILEKINFKIYIGLSIVLILLNYFLALDMREFKVMMTVFIAACINQYLLVQGIDKLTRQAATNEASDTGSIIGFFIGKVIVLIVALIFGVQIMGKRIIIPVIIYVLQIGILYLSLKSSGNDKLRVKLK